eukprot:SM000044S15960  [mRNA]  locus=s44:190646:192312:+ [translate_table: standard]
MAAAVASGGVGRLRVLCLHSFRAILRKQMSIARGTPRSATSWTWLLAQQSVVSSTAAAGVHRCADASERCLGPGEALRPTLLRVVVRGRGPTSHIVQPFDVEQVSIISLESLRMQDGKVYVGADTSITYVYDNQTLHGPFDDLLGFSQGGMLASYLLALLQKGLDMKVQPRLCILIGAGLQRADALAAAFRRPIAVPSLHLIGEQETRTFSRHYANCFKTATKIRSSFSIHVAMFFRA